MKAMIEPNLRNICIKAVRGEFNEFFKKSTFNNWFGSSYSGAVYWFDGRNGHASNKADYKCQFTHANPGVVLMFRAKNIDQLAAVCNCRVLDFPQQIQHWDYMGKRIRCGNPLLDRIDPMLYVLESDPFDDMNFSFLITLSKKEYLKICEEAGVCKDEFWKDEIPSCYVENCNYDLHDKTYTSCMGRFKRDVDYKRVLMKKCEKCKHWKGNSK